MENMNEIKLGEIVLCNLKLKAKNKESFILKDVVFSYDYDYKKTFLNYSIMNDRRIIKKTGLKENLTIISIEVLSRHGFKNKSKDYTEVKANKVGKRDKSGNHH